MPELTNTRKQRTLLIDDPESGRRDDPEELKPPQAWENRKATAQAYRASQARVASTRRRNVDPCTCDIDYTSAELEFMMAMQEYKQASGRMFPTWSEILEVLGSLGYEKSTDATATSLPS